MSAFLPYGRQAIDAQDVAAVASALRDELITQGPRVEAFEQAFAEACGARQAVAFASGTGALHAAAAVCDVGPGSEVLTTPISFVASSNCVLYAGGRPRFGDIDPDTLNLDARRGASDPRAARLTAAIGVSLAGLPADLQPLQPLRKQGVRVIEDASHALGARRGGLPVGGDGLADITVFSLHPVKAITTGEGGVAMTDDDALAERLRAFRTHGIVRGPLDRTDPLQGPWHYDVASLGFNYRITDFQCALGLSQLGKLDRFIERRNEIAERYRELLGELDGLLLPPGAPADGLHAYHLFVVRFAEGARRRRHVYERLREAGIGTQLHYVPIYRHTLYRELGYDEAAHLPEAERYYASALSLPVFPAMSDADVRRVAGELGRVLAEPLPTCSAVLQARARRLIPGASQTMSKGPTQWASGLAPAYLRRGAGARVQDVDGRWYLDFPMALGPVILGYAHPAVDEAIRAQLRDGITFTLPHPLELEVAERIAATVPNAERVRFAKSGSDVASAAIRLARAVTGRERVLAAGYHGWHDWYIGSTSWYAGVPDAVRGLTETVAWGELDSLRAALQRRAGEVAAVILEPVGIAEPAPGYLDGVVELAHEHGALAIFDEIVTGFRLAPGGAQERYGVSADLVCLGKALGNGMPVSALAGRAASMDALTGVFFSGTHGGETLSLAAARATLDTMAAEPVHEHLWRFGRRLQEGVRDAVARHGLEDWVLCGGAAPWTIVTVREPEPQAAGLPAKTLLQQEMLRRGVLYNGSNFVSFAHGDAEIEEAIDAYDGAFAELARALPDDVERLLEAAPVSRVFRSIA